MVDRYNVARRRVLATLGGFAVTFAVGAMVFSTTAAHGLEPAPTLVDACGARSHSCVELTECLGGALPEGVGCLEMSAQEALEKGLILR